MNTRKMNIMENREVKGICRDAEIFARRGVAWSAWLASWEPVIRDLPHLRRLEQVGHHYQWRRDLLTIVTAASSAWSRGAKQ